MRFSQRMDNLAPYLFAEAERKIAEKRAAGIDVISLGIGDPDLPTPQYIVDEMRRQVADPANDRYPSNWGHPDFAAAAASFYKRRFGVDIDPKREFMALLGAKEGLAHICLAILDPGDLALVPDPGYPVYAGGSILAGSEVRYLPLKPDNGFLPDLDAVSEEDARRAKVLFIGYPNNPTGAVVEDDFFARVVAFAKKYDIAVIHDNAYSELTYDGYVAPSFLATPGAKDVGVEFFSFSKPFNMTGWRTGFAVGNHRSSSICGGSRPTWTPGCSTLCRRRRPSSSTAPGTSSTRCATSTSAAATFSAEALTSVGMKVPRIKGTIYMWIPVPEGYTSGSFCEHVLEQAAVVITPGRGYGPAGEGFVRLSLTTPDDRLAEAVERIEKSLKL